MSTVTDHPPHEDLGQAEPEIVLPRPRFKKALAILVGMTVLQILTLTIFLELAGPALLGGRASYHHYLRAPMPYHPVTLFLAGVVWALNACAGIWLGRCVGRHAFWMVAVFEFLMLLPALAGHRLHHYTPGDYCLSVGLALFFYYLGIAQGTRQREAPPNKTP